MWQIVYLFADNLKSDIYDSKMELYKHANQAMTDINPKKPLTWEDVHSMFLVIKKLCELVNAVWGNMFTMFVAGYILFQSVYSETILVSGNYRVLLFFVNGAAFFIFAADAVHRVIYSCILGSLTINLNTKYSL